MNKTKLPVDKTISEILWQETIAIRHEVLWPNKPPEHCYIEDDDKGWHFGYFINDGLVSVASIYPSGNSARLRKFATLEMFQGRGVGTELLRYIISAIKQRGITMLWCDARASATGFYERFGMKQEGERFYKSEVAYYKMSVELT